MFVSNLDTSRASQSWMEHQSLEHIKRALRVTLDWHSPAITYLRKRQSVAFAFESFSRHMERLMAIEEQDGYMRMVADDKPNKAKRIATLREEHALFRSEITRLGDELDLLDDWQDAEFDEICQSICQLLISIDEHDRAEVQLLQDSLLLDEGGGD